MSVRLDYEHDSLRFRYEMAESYTKAQRNKRDLERKLKVINREIKVNMNLLNTRRNAIASGLLVSTAEIDEWMNK